MRSTELINARNERDRGRISKVMSRNVYGIGSLDEKVRALVAEA